MSSVLLEPNLLGYNLHLSKQSERQCRQQLAIVREKHGREEWKIARKRELVGGIVEEGEQLRLNARMRQQYDLCWSSRKKNI